MADSTEAVATTWNNTIEAYFTQMEIGCMRSIGFDLGNYEDVKSHTLNTSEPTGILYKDGIYARVKSGSMPKGGPRWTDTRCATYLAWAEAECPKD
jgi:hypothetical protein